MKDLINKINYMPLFQRICGVFLFMLIFSFSAFAQEETNDIVRANELYSEGEFLQAAHLYEQIILEKGVAPELYYNLGNAYFKANEIGHSILNYERALRLNPRFENARFNLQLAQTKVIDNITEDDTFFVKRWVDNLVNRYTSNQWMYFSWTMFILCLFGFLFFVFGKSRGLRKVSFTLAIVVLIISAFALTFSITRKNQFINHKDAIVMTGIVTIKSSPDRSGTDLFELHEGTKVSIKSNLGNWAEIVIGDGRIGWVEKRQIEQI